MGLSFKDAYKIIEAGQASDRIKRFVGSVKMAALTGNSAAVSLDDALVAALVLSQLADTADGRKLLKKPKRKNLQYRAEDFAPSSPEFEIAARVASGEIFFNEGLDRLESCFIERRMDADRERTLRRLLEDLVKRADGYWQGVVEMLMAAGWDGASAAGREVAARQIIEHLGFDMGQKK